MEKRIKKFLLPYKILILAACVLGILFGVFVSDLTSDLVILFLTALWILSIWLYHFEGKISVAGGLIFLALCPFLLIFNKETIAEKSAIWAYAFLVVGIGQLFLGYRREHK